VVEHHRRQTEPKDFYETSPVPGPILRLAFKPGQYQLRVTVLNHAVIAPGVTDVEVQDGRVTPVTVTLLPAGTVLVETKQAHAGGTYYGRYGRRTKISNAEAVNYEVIAESQPPLPFPAQGADALRRRAERLKAHAGKQARVLVYVVASADSAETCGPNRRRPCPFPLPPAANRGA
jgi:hypothetical protein